MKCIIVFLLNVVLFYGSIAKSAKGHDKYCNLDSCNEKQHTLCVYPEGNQCKKPISRGLSEQDEKTVVDLHNKLRKYVAAGNEKRGDPGPEPAAKKMNKLKWDDEIAMIAQRWADNFKFKHDSYRNTPGEYVGQNLALSGTTGDENTITVEQLIQMWYDEVEDFDAGLISQPFSGNGNSQSGAQTGHYTQFVWANTNKIGCGAVKYKDGEFKYVLLVCNYGPGGNIIDQYIYKPK